jgi:hypothetical protein
MAASMEEWIVALFLTLKSNQYRSVGSICCTKKYLLHHQTPWEVENNILLMKQGTFECPALEHHHRSYLTKYDRWES